MARFRRRHDALFDGLSEQDAAHLRAMLGQVEPVAGLEGLAAAGREQEETRVSEAPRGKRRRGRRS